MSTIGNDIKWRIGQATHPLALSGLAQELKFARLSPEERREADAALAERFSGLRSEMEQELSQQALGEWVNEVRNAECGVRS